MRPNSLLLLLSLALTGCANQGTVVRKESRPLPAYLTYGLEATYNFTLRTADGRLRSQMVTPAVFHRYAVGDYFNDGQPGPSGPEDAKIMRQVSRGPEIASDPNRRFTQETKRARRSHIARSKTRSKRATVVTVQEKASVSVAAGLRPTRPPPQNSRPAFPAPRPHPVEPALKLARVTQTTANPARNNSVQRLPLTDPKNDYPVVQVLRCR